MQNAGGQAPRLAAAARHLTFSLPVCRYVQLSMAERARSRIALIWHQYMGCGLSEGLCEEAKWQCRHTLVCVRICWLNVTAAAGGPIMLQALMLDSLHVLAERAKTNRHDA